MQSSARDRWNSGISVPPGFLGYHQVLSLQDTSHYAKIIKISTFRWACYRPWRKCRKTIFTIYHLLYSRNELKAIWTVDIITILVVPCWRGLNSTKFILTQTWGALEDFTWRPSLSFWGMTMDVVMVFPRKRKKKSAANTGTYKHIVLFRNCKQLW